MGLLRTNADVLIDGVLRVVGELGSLVGGVGIDLLPDDADTRSLGSTAKEWKNLYIGDAGKIYLGLAQDVNLYRSAANVLKTDDNFDALALRIGGTEVIDYSRRLVGLDSVYQNLLPYSSGAFYVGNSAYYWYIMYTEHLYYKKLHQTGCAKELSGLPVSPKFKTVDEAEQFLRHETTKEWLHIKYGEKEGTIECTCGKEVVTPCPEHEEEWRDKYSLNTGDMIKANSKLILNLLDRIENLEKKIK